MASAADSILDYTQTHRIVLLVDLNPLLRLSDPTRFLASLLSSIKTITSFAPLSSSLFAFRFFFSSLSPLFSSSKLPSHSLSLSFNPPGPTLISLSQTLKSLSVDANGAAALTPPRADFFAAAMRQLVHDYAWEPVSGMFRTPHGLRSNLVVVFSPFSSGFSSSENCERMFENVEEAFVSRDIQLSWVDVRFGLECECELGDELKCFESLIRRLGWGFSSSDSIVLGSAIVPFGLIYPEIGVSSNVFRCDGFRRRVRAEMSLEISDVKGMPLECKVCDLELADLRMLRRCGGDDDLLLKESMKSVTFGRELKRLFWGSVGGGVMRIEVKALQEESELVKFKGKLSNPILVREVSGGFFVDKVLEMLSVELGEFVPRKLAPVWQILLSFLYREGCWAIVSLSDDSGVSHTGIIKPFTVSSALLFIFDERMWISGAVNVDLSASKMNNEIHKPDDDLVCGSQTGPSSSYKRSADVGGKKKSSRRNLLSLQDIAWSDFCNAAFEYSDIHLEEIYFARQCSNSKKLKFLKCWMKQIKKLKYSMMEKVSKAHLEDHNEIENRLETLHQESERPMSSSGSAGENPLALASGIQDEAAQEYCLETSEAFFCNLSSKIRQGIDSEAVDLGALAHRLVNSSIYWLKQNETTTPLESQTPTKSDNIDVVAAELLKLLLRDPKDMVARHKSYDPGSEGFTSEKMVREYELQLFFRMEILQSEVGASIRDSVKRKFVKHICTLLESIRAQCHLEGGFFGDWTLESYVGKIIKSRYCKTLGDVVDEIYTKMDLLLFDDEEELPNNLFNSEDSNQSYRENPGRRELDENSRMKEFAAADDESLDVRKLDSGRQDEHARKLIEAQESRERARRFASFTSRVADLQRVWAPKQPKVFKPKSNSYPKRSKRKERTDSCYERVLETPMTENKRIHIDDKSYGDYGDQSGRSVSKSLFQED